MNLAKPLTPMSTAGSTPATSVFSEILDTCVQDSARQKAEILWAIKHVYNGFSENSTQDVGIFLELCFHTARLQKECSCGQTYFSML